MVSGGVVAVGGGGGSVTAGAFSVSLAFAITVTVTVSFAVSIALSVSVSITLAITAVPASGLAVSLPLFLATTRSILSGSVAATGSLDGFTSHLRTIFFLNRREAIAITIAITTRTPGAAAMATRTMRTTPASPVPLSIPTMRGSP